MRNPSKILLPLTLVGLGMLPQQAQKPSEPASSEYKIPAEAAKQSNPVKPTPASIALGRKLYGYDCAMCHGPDGNGKGDLAQEIKLALRDFRDPSALKDRTDGELYYIILNGKGEMPKGSDREKPEDVWNLVNYIRSVARKDNVAKPSPATP